MVLDGVHRTKTKDLNVPSGGKKEAIVVDGLQLDHNRVRGTKTQGTLKTVGLWWSRILVHMVCTQGVQKEEIFTTLNIRPEFQGGVYRTLIGLSVYMTDISTLYKNFLFDVPRVLPDHLSMELRFLFPCL